MPSEHKRGLREERHEKEAMAGKMCIRDRIMYVYEQEIILRARNFLTGQWLTEYDCALPLDGLHTAGDDGKGR